MTKTLVYVYRMLTEIIIIILFVYLINLNCDKSMKLGTNEKTRDTNILKSTLIHIFK